jgi:hypothetical protein
MRTKRIKRALVASILLTSLGIAVFDILRLTLWQSASWNYQYPRWAIIFDPVAVTILMGISAILILNLEYILTLSERKFIMSLIMVGALLCAISYFYAPVSSFRRTLAPLAGPENFEYYPATVAATDGISTFFSEYQTLPTSVASGDRRSSAKLLGSRLSSVPYVPGNEWLATEAREIVTQRHGPLPALSIAIFLFIFGVSPGVATIGTQILAVFVPLVGYFVFKLYFSVRYSRIGALFILFSPAYLRYTHTETIGNDIITTLFVGIALIALFYAIQDSRYRYWFVAGIASSLPALSKFTVGVYTIPIVLFIIISQRNADRSFVTFGIFSTGFLVIPLIAYTLGFNTLLMYLYSVARVAVSSSGQSGIFPYLISYYNLRLMGPPVLLLVGAAVLHICTNRKSLFDIDKQMIVLSFLPAFIPFMFIGGVTLSRHFLIHIYALVFITLYMIENITEKETVRFIQLCLVSTLLVSMLTLN